MMGNAPTGLLPEVLVRYQLVDLVSNKSLGDLF